MGSIGCSLLATEPVLIDARGLKCPLPVLKLEKQLAALSSGTVLVVLATDPMARIDIALYCRQHGHQLGIETDDDTVRFTVVKA